MPFLFEAMWVDSEDCKKVISQPWGDNEVRGGMPRVMEKIRHCENQLKLWNRESFRTVRKRIKEAEANLYEITQADPLFPRPTKHKEARGAVNKWLEREEKMWSQRSKIMWLREGDRNTRYFHNMATVRHKKNFIGQIQDEGGCWHNGGDRDMVIIDYFEKLFTSSS